MSSALSSPLLFAHLRTFVHLANDLHFTRTAEALHLSQPAVSQHVRALEHHFGVKLIERGHRDRKLTLTPAGRFLAERAVPLIERVAAIDREMLEFSELKNGRLSLGATLTIGSYGLAGFVCMFRRAHPAIELDIIVENTASVAARVLQGELSIGLVEGAINAEGLDEMPYAEDRLMLIFPPGHRLAKIRRALTVADLVDENFIMRELGSGTRSQFESAMLAAGTVPRVVLALPSSEGILQAVEAGLGLAVVSSLISDAAVKHGRLCRRSIADLHLQRTFRLIRRAHVTPSPATIAFSTIVRSGRGTGRNF